MCLLILTFGIVIDKVCLANYQLTQQRSTDEDVIGTAELRSEVGFDASVREVQSQDLPGAHRVLLDGLPLWRRKEQLVNVPSMKIKYAVIFKDTIIEERPARTDEQRGKESQRSTGENRVQAVLVQHVDFNQEVSLDR